MKRKKNIDEVAKELYEHRHDPGEWGEEAIPVEVRPAKTTLISCRLPVELFDEMVEAMTAMDESLSEYVRKAIALRLQSDALNMPGVTISYGTPSASPRQHVNWATWTTAPATMTPGEPQSLRLVG